MLRDYEFTIVIRPDLSEEDLAAVLTHYEGKIAARDGTVLRKDTVRTKRFSYPIKRCFRGYFVNYDISADPKIVKDMEQQMRFDEKVLRHLIVGMEKRKSAAVREEVAAEQKRIAQAQAESAPPSTDETSNTPSSTQTGEEETPSQTAVGELPPPVAEVVENESSADEGSADIAEEMTATDDTPPPQEERRHDDPAPLPEGSVIDQTHDENSTKLEDQG